MKKLITTAALFLALAFNVKANDLPRKEYPRPQFEREDWINLNGTWTFDFDFGQSGVDRQLQNSEKFSKNIIVPFCPESELSGVKHTDFINCMWYQRKISIPANWNGKKIFLNFGAVDYWCEIYIDGKKIQQHWGGSSSFAIDITRFVQAGNTHNLVIQVKDDLRGGKQTGGKQCTNFFSGGCSYTRVTGIWQTVWMEPVAERHITNVRTTSDIDRKKLTVDVTTSTSCPSEVVEVKVFDGKQLVATGKGLNGQTIDIQMPADAKLWSPASPTLYSMQIALLSNGKVTDKVDSYTAMRKYSTRRDKDGIVRLQLNNEDVFQFGPLDQGWWPDGLYTAPTDEALVYDIQKTKDFGFNMIRKHVKVEPARWYTHCDKLGIIVWQDMPNGDREPEWQMYNYFTGNELNRSEESEQIYRKEWKEIMDYLYNYPCIGVWVPFNERWGQFKTEDIATWTKKYDPSRLVNPASGGNHFPCGDILDLHHYPNPSLDFYDAGRATVLGEYGGIGLALNEHLWEPNHNWGYVKFNSPEEVTKQYVEYGNELYRLISRGLSAAVYTQTTDVEMEVNGLMTYDRKVIKVNEAQVKAINTKICNSLNK